MNYCFYCKVKPQCDARGDEVAAQSGIWGGKKRTKPKPRKESE